MKLTKVAALCISTALVFNFAACGNKAEPSTTAPTSGTNEGNPESSGDDISLTFYAWSDEEGIFNALAEAYTAKNPNVSINMQFTPSNDYNTKLLTAFSGGGDIDCFAVASPPTLAQFQSKGSVMALDELIDQTEIDTSGYQVTLDGIAIDGKTYALPYKSSSWVVYYNKDIFDAAGVPYPTDNWTWEEYFEIAGQLTSGEGPDKIYGSLNFQPISLWWRVPANSKGDINPILEEQLDSWLEAAEFAKKMSDAGYQPLYEDMSDEAGADYTGNFLQGKYGMFYNGDWEVEMLNSSLANGDGDVNYDIAALPHWEGEKAYTPGAPGLLLVAQNAKNPEAAFDFITFCSSEEGAEILLARDYFPAWQSDLTIETYTKGIETPEHIEYIVNQDIIAQVPCDEYYNSASNVVKEEVALYLIGEQDIDKTKEVIMKRIQDEVLIGD